MSASKRQGSARVLQILTELQLIVAIQTDSALLLQGGYEVKALLE
jgi:hypothetical protein